MTTKAEMVAALFGGAPSEETPPTEAAASSISAGERLATQPPSEVLATFGVRFACFAAADVPNLPGAAAIEQTGKVLLPRSCLAGLAFLRGRGLGRTQRPLATARHGDPLGSPP